MTHQTPRYHSIHQGHFHLLTLDSTVNHFQGNNLHLEIRLTQSQTQFEAMAKILASLLAFKYQQVFMDEKYVLLALKVLSFQ